MQLVEDAFYDYCAGDATLLDLLGGSADRILGEQPQVVETFPCVTFETLPVPALDDATPFADATLQITVQARDRRSMNTIAERLVDQLHVSQARRTDQRPFVIPGRIVSFCRFINPDGQVTYEPSPRDVFRKVLDLRLIHKQST